MLCPMTEGGTTAAYHSKLDPLCFQSHSICGRRSKGWKDDNQALSLRKRLRNSPCFNVGHMTPQLTTPSAPNMSALRFSSSQGTLQYSCIHMYSNNSICTSYLLPGSSRYNLQLYNAIPWPQWYRLVISLWERFLIWLIIITSCTSSLIQLGITSVCIEVCSAHISEYLKG